MVPRSIGLADDHTQKHRAQIPTICFIPKVLGFGDECRKYKSAGSGQHDPATSHGRQTWYDRYGLMCGAW